MTTMLRTMEWVAQREDWDCGIATLAMVAGHSYDRVRADFGAAEDHRREGLTPTEMQRYLWREGFFLRCLDRRVHAPRGVWPPLAFAWRHFLIVQSPTRPTGHWVAMDSDGSVLDPFDASRNGQPSSIYRRCYMAWGVSAPMEERR